MINRLGTQTLVV